MRAISCWRAFFALWTTFSSGLSLRVLAASLARSAGSLLLLPVPETGRSRMCPTLDFTTNSLPRYLLMVFALAGDSTMTRDLLIKLCDPGSLNPVTGSAACARRPIDRMNRVDKADIYNDSTHRGQVPTACRGLSNALGSAGWQAVKRLLRASSDACRRFRHAECRPAIHTDAELPDPALHPHRGRHAIGHPYRSCRPAKSPPPYHRQPLPETHLSPCATRWDAPRWSIPTPLVPAS